jgi:tetratricopeptide (TPR) repeat protein
MQKPTPHVSQLAIIFAAIVAFTYPSSLCGQSANTSERSSTDSVHRRVGVLIQQLADPSYSSRLNAQAELDRIGVLALDQLHLASFHPNPQIASLARFIVQSNQFSWSWESDSAHVRQVLTNYSNAPLSEKSTFIDRLSRLERDEGFTALCRLVRYETQSGLAKQAALLLMRSQPTVSQTVESRKEALFENTVGGQSQASQWIQKYSMKSTTEFDLEWWQKTLQDEIELLRKNTGETNVESVADLHRWIIEQISLSPSMRERALAMGRSLMNLGSIVATLDTHVGARGSNVDEFAQWALKYRMPELVQEQHDKLPISVVSREFLFGYYLAESYLLQGDQERANAIAERSRNQVPSRSTGQERVLTEAETKNPLRIAIDGVFERPNFGNMDRRATLAEKLRDRGQFSWAEAEYRLALYSRVPSSKKQKNKGDSDSSEDGDEKGNAKDLSVDLTLPVNLFVMWHLAEMLHWQDRHADAADTLEPFVKRFENEPMFSRQMSESSRLIEQILTNYHLYRGDEARLANDVAKASFHYWQSIERSADNVDAIIGLYKLPQSTDDQTKRRTKLKEIVTELRNQIRLDEENIKSATVIEFAYFQSELSSACNTLAWTISNTEGSKEEALYLSRRACVLAPESAELLDTLAHCYASMGKFEDAVQQQRSALQLKPHHPELKKALALFELRLTESNK